MYQVSQDYLDKIKEPLVIHSLTGLIDSVIFTDNDIIEGSFTVSRQICDSSKIQFGGLFVGQLTVTFIADKFKDSIPRGSWIGKKISFSVGTWIDDNIGFEWVPGGVFTISEANHTTNGIEVIAYDDITKFDRKYNGRVFGGNLTRVVQELCSYLGIVDDWQSSDPGFDNWGLVELSLENSFDTWRDYLSALLESRGCYGYINRYGKFVYRSCEDWLQSSAGNNGGEIFEISKDERFNNISVSDYETTILGASYTVSETNEIVILGGQSDRWSFYDFGSNPFMQDSFGLDRFTAIYNDLITALDVVPYSVTTNSEIALDFGDFVYLPDGLGGYITSPIMSFDYTYKHSVTYSGFGENPAKSSSSTSGGSSSGGSSAIAASKIAFYYQESQSSFDIETTDRQLVNSIEFLADTEAEAQTWTEIKGTISKDDPNTPVKVKVIYLYDDEQIGYSPEFTFDEDGYQTLSLNYFLDYIDPSISHIWDVALEVEGGSFQIANNEVHTLIWGQGLSKVEKWSGRIRISDELAIYLLRYQPEVLKAFTVSANVDLYTPIDELISDIVGSYQYKANLFNIFAEFCIITVGEPNPNSLFFAGEDYAGDLISTGLI